jgi:N-acetylglucosaminyldiphosphoundecaprenol N-acetyl-beta-D-mannosaminyltransferase
MSQAVSELSVFGIPVNVLGSYQDAVRLIRSRIVSRQQTFCVALNPLKIYRAVRDPALLQILNSADIRTCDGIGVSWATLLLHRTWTPRVTGIQLFLDLVELAAREGWNIFLLGASPESNAAARLTLLQRHPTLRIAGSRDGFFEDSDEVVRSINESGADLVFIAMGSPRQELWISEHLPRLNPVFCMGVGGSLDAISGAANWAPRVFRATGTEWLYRILMQPRRLRPFALALLFALDVLRATPLFARSAAGRQAR